MSHTFIFQGYIGRQENLWNKQMDKWNNKNNSSQTTQCPQQTNKSELIFWLDTNEVISNCITYDELKLMSDTNTSHRLPARLHSHFWEAQLQEWLGYFHSHSHPPDNTVIGKTQSWISNYFSLQGLFLFFLLTFNSVKEYFLACWLPDCKIASCKLPKNGIINRYVITTHMGLL